MTAPEPSGSPDELATPAAVLLALAPVAAADDLDLVLVERPAHMRRHAGQVGLPGGAADPGDADGIATALREASEEVGLDPGQVRVLGALGRAYLPVSNFDVLPVVGLWDGQASLKPNPSEVARVLRPTLRQLADPANHESVPLDRLIPPEEARGRTIPPDSSPVYRVDGVVVWGFTAALLSVFLRLLELPAPPLPGRWHGRMQLPT